LNATDQESAATSAVSVTPSAGSGGGGGGGSYIPIPTPTPTPTPIASPSVTASPVATASPSSTSSPQASPAASSAPQASPSVTVDANLRFGMSGNEVRDLQTLLAKDSAIYPLGKVTGYFGPATLAAVQKFQKKHGFVSAGFVGPVTRAKLAEIFASGKTPANIETPASPQAKGLTKFLSQGSSNDEVKLLQEFLARDKNVYPEGVVSGYFGSLTRVAVIKFQAKYGISQVGIVGPVTRAKINELLSK